MLYVSVSLALVSTCITVLTAITAAAGGCLQADKQPLTMFYQFGITTYILLLYPCLYAFFVYFRSKISILALGESQRQFLFRFNRFNLAVATIAMMLLFLQVSRPSQSFVLLCVCGILLLDRFLMLFWLVVPLSLCYCVAGLNHAGYGTFACVKKHAQRSGFLLSGHGALLGVEWRLLVSVDRAHQ